MDATRAYRAFASTAISCRKIATSGVSSSANVVATVVGSRFVLKERIRQSLDGSDGRYWTRTSDFYDVNVALYQLS